LLSWIEWLAYVRQVSWENRSPQAVPVGAVSETSASDYCRMVPSKGNAMVAIVVNVVVGRHVCSLLQVQANEPRVVVVEVVYIRVQGSPGESRTSDALPLSGWAGPPDPDAVEFVLQDWVSPDSLDHGLPQHGLYLIGTLRRFLSSSVGHVVDSRDQNSHAQAIARQREIMLQGWRRSQ
jgi:hypothetical protein